MTLRLSLVIDGTADGAKRAIADVRAAINQAAADSTKLSEVQRRINDAVGVRDTNTAARAADIAAYGKSLDDLRARYNPLFAAQRNYLQELAAIKQAQALGAFQTQGEYVGAIERTKTAFAAQVVAMRQSGDEHVRLTAQGMALQHALRSMAEGAFFGLSPLQILGMQVSHLTFAASGPGGLKGALEENLALLRGLPIASVAVTGGILAVAGAAAAAFFSWQKFALQLDDVAKQAGTTSTAMAQLQAAAGFKGIGQDEFARGAKQFSEQVYQAVNGMGQLAVVFRANNVQAKDFDDALNKAADLIKNASSDQQRLVLLQQMGLPATMQWVRLLQGGSAGLQQARQDAAAFGGTLNDELVKKAREFDEAWNKAWTNFGLSAKRAFVEMFNVQPPAWFLALMKVFSGDTFQQGFGLPAGATPGRVGEAFSALSGSSNPALEQALQRRAAQMRGDGNTSDPAAAIAALQREQQRIALLGSLATVEEQVRSKEAAIQLARLNGVAISKQQEGAILALTRAQAEQSKAQERVQLGVATEQELRHVQALQLDLAVRRGLITTTQELAAAQTAYQKQLEETIRQSQIAAAQLPGLKRLELEAGDLRGQLDKAGTDISQGIGSAFVDIATGAKSAGAAFADMARTIERALANMLVQMLIVQPIARALQGLLGGFLGGGGGLLNFGTEAVGVPGITTGFDTGGWTGNGPVGAIAGVVHRKEFVVRAGPAEKHLALLQAINRGNIRVPGYAGGGFVGDASMPIGFGRPIFIMPPPPAGASAQPSVNFKVEVHNVPDGATLEDTGRRRREGDADIVELSYKATEKGIANGRFDPALDSRRGAQRQIARR